MCIVACVCMFCVVVVAGYDAGEMFLCVCIEVCVAECCVLEHAYTDDDA